MGRVGFAAILAIGSYSPIRNTLAPPSQIVASAPFTEQFILSEVIKDLLVKADFEVDQRQGMGETIQFYALKRNQIDCCVNYTGNIWVPLMHRKGRATDDDYEEIKRFMKKDYGVEVLGKLGIQNNYVLAVHPKFAEKHQIKDISDLAKHNGKFRIAGDEQFFNRPESRWRTPA